MARRDDEQQIAQLMTMSATDAATVMEAHFKSVRAAEVECWRLWNLVSGGRPGARGEESQSGPAAHLVSIVQVLNFGERSAA